MPITKLCFIHTVVSKRMIFRAPSFNPCTLFQLFLLQSPCECLELVVCLGYFRTCCRQRRELWNHQPTDCDRIPRVVRSGRIGSRKSHVHRARPGDLGLFDCFPSFSYNASNNTPETRKHEGRRLGIHHHILDTEVRGGVVSPKCPIRELILQTSGPVGISVLRMDVTNIFTVQMSSLSKITAAVTSS